MSKDKVRPGKVVYITYSMLADDGRVMGQQDMPTGYVHGANSGLFPEIERGLEGCRVDDQVEIALSPGESFGASDPDLIIIEEIDNVPPSIRYVGAEAELQNDKGDTLTFRVVDIAEGKITLDGNHPLAGRDAVCVVKIVSVRDATPEEVRSGFPTEQGPPQLH